MSETKLLVRREISVDRPGTADFGRTLTVAAFDDGSALITYEHGDATAVIPNLTVAQLAGICSWLMFVTRVALHDGVPLDDPEDPTAVGQPSHATTPVASSPVTSLRVPASVNPKAKK